MCSQMTNELLKKILVYTIVADLMKDDYISKKYDTFEDVQKADQEKSFEDSLYNDKSLSIDSLDDLFGTEDAESSDFSVFNKLFKK